MKRRGVLAACSVAIAGIAGCSRDAGTAEANSGTATRTGTGTDTATQTDAGIGTDTSTDAGTGTVTRTGTSSPPPGCPTTSNLGVDWPDSPSVESTRTFLKDYEAAYLRQRKIPDGVGDVYVEVTPDSIESVDGGFVGNLSVTYGWCGIPEGRSTPEGEETLTPVCVDARDETVAYYVTDTVVRRVGPGDDVEDPRDGTLLECREN